MPDGCRSATALNVQQLRNVGLDLNFLLDQVFFSDILEAIVRYEARCMSQIGKGVNDDNFNAVDLSTEDVGAQIVEPGARMRQN
ncbi:MAG: hypothetical protein BJ554DRAFT_7450 [Olpidium bornovanus]|uniref:Uncharacterized protein n=1 Tax=Olpidium bornovanus TaxID=278681 RepID=A0A8H7ZWF8_9FUNG|nr:MAG: hypothetical protein BJ554DRAFT_7450 [Olpidium bornovanus]